ncbi:hypothetical protein AUK40_05515 [Candidatus Wirthbacteria bacterium CG2_30_54_11]|uniref:DUF916 domain-containing protein n=1 Tax=Candidatus Wirthbacteria bacterium CG2_30_54_11 TaxID=1817892 RepID=A0A1J5IS29_9BACT|nr:MAG: hypothetical protein AUK40_05515 [Candidatus Wirthbacteria bacterium CG2_30_54_11]
MLKKLGIALGFALCLASLTGSPAQAESVRRAISITPSKTELSLSPGSSWQGEVELSIDDPVGVSLVLEAVDFRSAEGDEGGTPEFYQAEASDITGVLSRWITLGSTELTSEPGQIVRVPVSITVPLNAEPGGHYGAVLFHTSPVSTSSTGASTGSSIASLFLVTVAGRMEQSGEIVEFFMGHDFYETLPAEAVVRFRNTGNIHLKPRGTITYTSWFGNQIGESELNPAGGNVLPNSIRRITTSFGEQRDMLKTPWFTIPVSRPFAMGLYTARLSFDFGPGTETITATTTFVVFPWRAVLFVSGLLILAVLLFLGFRYRYIQGILKRFRDRRLEWK